ncbi:MAG: dihydroorotate dehydrogenase [Caldiserica bacterium]|jgi:dihydroorotate dehydrogenase (NAD+) catalytic subunit|nr:dihydroorotate dehydrogenase [Caldisericota bacterium]MDH7562157.1 dihydroorotate dehydrogenase [Caldisericota bacterium]
MVASGTYGWGEEAESLIDLDSLGAFVTKTVTLNPRQGNPSPRIWETPSGLLNSIGLQNNGLNEFLKNSLPLFKKYRVPLVVSIAGETIDEFLDLAMTLESQSRVDALEINVSCPNVKEGMLFGTSPKLTGELVRKLRKACSKTMIVKLTPNTGEIKEVARAAEEEGADCLALVNTFLGMAIDPRTRRSRLATTFGGLSGPAIKPLALRLVYEVSKAVKTPVIGMGGIISGEDALEFIIAGAYAIAVGSASFRRPDAPIKVLEELESILDELGIESLEEIRGTFKDG